MNTLRVVGASVAVAAAAGILAGCADSERAVPGKHHGTPPASQPPAGASRHNDADVAFAQGMIPHHSQAIEMSRLAPERAQSEQVKDLARKIEAAQGPEIGMLKGWLRSWGAPSPHGGMHGMEHGGMHGMMTPEDMRTLREAKGAEFDRMFLTMMIKHHEGAVDMARTEVAQGESPDAKDLAQRIIDAQQAEIKTMQDLLNQR